MDFRNDRYNIKDRILKDVGKSIKLIQQFSVGSGSDGNLNSNSWLVQSLSCHLDLAFRHGLREPLYGFWPLLQNLCHSDTFHLIDNLQHVTSSLGKGQTWLHHTLMEGSLQSYLMCLARDNVALKKYYSSQALLRDSSSVQQLLTLLAGLEYITFNMNTDGTEHLESSGLSGVTSMTSSLSSPVDSGVALLDSDVDVTSVNEATANEADMLSLREDDAVLPELDNRINDCIVSQEGFVAKDSGSHSHKYSSKEKGQKNNLVRNISAEDVRLLKEKISRGELNASQLLDDNGDPTVNCSSFLTRKHSDKPYSEAQKCTCSCNLINDGMHEQKCESYIMSKFIHPNNQKNSKEIEVNRMSKSCLALTEMGNSVENNLSVLENSKSDNSLLHDNWMRDKDQMSMSLDYENTVVRRQRKKKRTGPDAKIKRVSFHEDFINQGNESAAGFSASFLPPNPVIKCDVVKGRYSWCAEGDAPFFERKNSNDTKSDVYLSSSNVTFFKEDTPADDADVKSDVDYTHSAEVRKPNIVDSAKVTIERCHAGDNKMPPVTERGTPEGQEDPPKATSLLHLNSITDSILKKFPSVASSIDWSDTDSDLCDRHASQSRNRSTPISGKENLLSPLKIRNSPHRLSAFIPASKTTLLSRFMRSLTEKKQIRRKVKLPKQRSLYIPGARPDPAAACQFLSELEAVQQHTLDPEDRSCVVTPLLEKAIRSQIFKNSEEFVYKVFKVSSSYFLDGKTKPMLLVMGTSGLYFIGLRRNLTFCLHFTILYKELDVIVVGPNYQTLYFVSVHRKKHLLVSSGDRVVTKQIVGYTDIAVRRSPHKPVVPSVGQLALNDMSMLKLLLSRENSSLKGEELQHYSIVQLQDNPTSPPSTPLGPTKEGHLMFRPATDAPLQPWEPGYFILKGGVVYMFADQGSRLPKRVIPLYNGQCLGCRRMSHEARPHTFEILLGWNRSFQFAAADEYEASEWLQALVQAASGVYEMDHINTTPCSLIISSNYILTCQEKYPPNTVTVLTCATITNLVSLCYMDDSACWCILEFACHEVHESSGDWALYFSTPEAMLTFKNDLKQCWSSLTPLSFPEALIADKGLHHRCEETCQHLMRAWDDMLFEHQK